MTKSTHLDAKANPKIRLKAVALPAEHGSWGFLFEPIVAGLLIAPTSGGLFLALATIGAFLMRFPLKLYAMDLRRGKYSNRTSVIKNFVLLYGIIAVLFFFLTLKTSVWTFLVPLLIASPLALLQLIADFSNKSRSLFAELSGATALASVAASMAIIDGWTLGKSLAIWLIIAARIVPSILYVRAKIKIIHGQKAQRFSVILFHIVGLGLVGLLVWKDVSPFLAIIVLLILLIRAVYGLSRYNTLKTAKAVGIRELIYGTIMVIALAIGYAFSV